MSSRILIGLTGFKQAGKSTVAKELVEVHDFTEMMFAHPIKEIIMKQLFHMNDQQIHGDQKEVVDPRYNMSPRGIMQMVGTDWFRNAWPDFWVDHAMRVVEQAPDGQNIVISDVRFLNEAEAIWKRGGVVVRVIRHGQESTDFHASELENLNIKEDVIFGAISGDIDKLHAQVAKYLMHLKAVRWAKGGNQ